jgi:hypothetical protein
MRYAIRRTSEYKAVENRLRSNSRTIKNRKISLRFKLKKIEELHPEYKAFGDIIFKNISHSTAFIKKQIIKTFNVSKESLKDFGKYFFYIKEYAFSRAQFEAKRKKILAKTKEMSLKQLKGKRFKNNTEIAESIIGFEKIFNSILDVCDSHVLKFRALIGALKTVFAGSKGFSSETALIYRFNAEKETLKLPDFL